MLFLGIVCAFFSFLYRYSAWQDWLKEANMLSKLSDTPYNSEPQAFIFANSWIGGEEYSLGFAIFYFLFPIMVAMPYSWSYVQEEKSGYMRVIGVTISKKSII